MYMNIHSSTGQTTVCHDSAVVYGYGNIKRLSKNMLSKNIILYDNFILF